MAEEQSKTTFEVLKQLNIENKPTITVFNKIDLCQDKSKLERLRNTYPKAVELSALHHTGFSSLLDAMILELSKQRRSVLLRIPQSDYGIVSEVIRYGNVTSKEYDENDVLLHVDLPNAIIDRFMKYLESDHG